MKTETSTIPADMEMSIESLADIFKSALSVMSRDPVVVEVKGSAQRILYVKMSPHDYPRVIGSKGSSLKEWRKLAGWMGECIGERVTVEVLTVPRDTNRHSQFTPDMNWRYSNIQSVIENIIGWIYGEAIYAVDESMESFLVDIQVSSLPHRISLTEATETLTLLLRSMCNPNGRKINLTIYQ